MLNIEPLNGLEPEDEGFEFTGFDDLGIYGIFTGISSLPPSSVRPVI